MKYVIYIFLIITIVFIILFLIAILRTLLLKPKKAFYEYSDDMDKSNEYANKLSKMVQYETISVRGENQEEKFRGFHKVLEELFPNVFNNLEKIEIDGNLLMKWKGLDDSLDPIILISHQDVVPADGTWIYPPFSGTIADGKIYGRGTGDIKCGVFSFYQAVEELLISGYRPKCDIYLGSSCTEEIGGDGASKIVNWFKNRNIHLFLLSDEGGSIVENPVGGVSGAFAAIGIFEKGYGDIKFSAISNGGHSSTPKKNTPIPKLAKFINYVETHNIFKKKLTKPVKAMFTNLAPYADSFFLKMFMYNLWLFKPLLLLLIGDISNEALAMFKTTVCFTMCKGSDGYNVIPSLAYVTANLRYIPHQGMEESNKKIMKLAKKFGLESEFITGNDYSNSLDLDGLPYQMTVKTINKVFPNVGIMPYVVTGGTDSRFFDPICDNCVRFSPIIFTKDQLKGMHGLNENITISTLPKAVEYYKELIKVQEER